MIFRLLSLILIFSVGAVFAQKNVELVVQSGHFETINAVAFSPDAKFLASGGKDNKIIIWDLKTGKEFRELKSHEKGVKNLLFTQDGKRLISGGDSRDRKLVVWDWQTGKIIWEKENATGNSVEAMAISNSGKYLACGTYTQLTMWNLETGELIYELEKDRNLPDNQIINHSVESILFSPDDEFFVMGVYGKGVMIKNTSDGAHIGFLNVKEHECGNMAMAWKNKGKSLLVSGSNDNITIWDIESKKLLEKFENNGRGRPCPCRFNSDASQFASACSGDIHLMDIKLKQPIYELRDVWTRATESISISANNQFIAISGEDQNDNSGIKIYNLKTQQMIKELSGYANAITSLDFNEQGSKLAVGSKNRYARIWDLISGKGFKNYSEEIYVEGDVYSDVKFGHNGEKLFQGIQHSFWVWEVESTSFVHHGRDGGSGNHHMAMSRNGKYMALNSPKLFDQKSYEKLAQLERPRLQSKSVSFAHDSKTMYAGGWKEIKVYHVGKEESERTLEADGYVETIRPYKNNDQLLIDDHGTIKIIELKEGTVTKEFEERMTLPALSKDEKFIATTNKNHEVLVFDAESGDKLWTLKGHDDHVKALEFSPKGNILASGSDDTKIIFWNYKTGEQIATLLALDKEDFIMVTPDNYYMTSKGGVNGVAFRLGNKVFPFEQFDLHYNRPDIVLKRIGLASEELIKAYELSYQKRLKKAGFSSDNFEEHFEVPELEIINSSGIGIETNEASLTLNISASDLSYNLDRILIWNNDVPVKGSLGMSLLKQSTKEYKGEIEIPLATGNNKIQLSVMNTNGVESYKETVEIFRNSSAKKPTLYLLSIGASEFKESEYNLHYAGKDASDIAAAFQVSEVYESVKSKILVGDQVTRENVLAQRSFLNQAGIDDVVMIFIAGHGVLNQQLDYYFATHNMSFDVPAKEGVSYQEIESLLDGLKSLRKLLFMDTCHSGELDKEDVEESMAMNETDGDIVFRNVGVAVQEKQGFGMYNTSELVKELFTDLRRGTGATVISSAGGAELAMESEQWKNGLFTYCLLNGLKGDLADLNDDGKVLLSELQQYVVESVTKLSGGRQIPTSRMENHTLDYRLW